MLKKKTQEKFDKWFNDHNEKPFYIIGERHWDEGTEYYLCAFEQTEEMANKIKNILWKKYVETEPFGFVQVMDAKKDMTFFKNHKDFTFD